MRTLSYPFWCLELEQFRPGVTMSLEEYILKCYEYGFGDMCRVCFGFTDEELSLEHRQWMAYILQNIPEIYPGIEQIIRRQKEAGGLICVVSHSSFDNISRDYRFHFGIQPDAIYGWDRPPQERKPNPWPLQDIMERFHLEPEEILVVDDMKLACQMAQPLGVAVGYAAWDDMGVPQLREEMENICDFTFYSIKELEDFLFE
jgi:phosphoglycolate phosphatase/pyrophosphatase PpaX